ncbi:SPL family radical SAM protein [Sinanaerobacter sp. ZZT-01]|uniref:SPL family radical SAM protein n=1 Tax=Sinanaerobacter sp. ZZT-01 TaxID=3111540 RepID=UPI002D799EC9|nr:spore photoproduct lyase [Sinanaerobacter sp. ZZT-01]WRR95132.1 spore photoproduct lyase [Sinanaerobacter sp. ZZT-01]
MGFDAVYYEAGVLDYPLGEMLQHKYTSLPWIEIENHNRIPEMTSADNRDFPKLKNHLIIGIRKTHRYVANHKVSDWLVPYTSSGCKAMCLYCYLVCNYNKCAYLRLFVNREQMLDRLLKKDAAAETPQTFEIGSNSDLILENTITDNLVYTIERFGREGRGKLTFPTKFDMVTPLLKLEHRAKTIFRMSVNPEEIIKRVELGTSPLSARIRALNDMAEAGYPVGLLIAPVILLPNWKNLYSELIDRLADELSDKVMKNGFIEMILMTYSFVQNAINTDAFPNAVQLFDRKIMTGRGRGKYCYRNDIRDEAESFLREKLSKRLGTMRILYIS